MTKKSDLSVGAGPAKKTGDILDQQHDTVDFYTELFVEKGEPRMIKVYGHRALDDQRSRIVIVKRMQELLDHTTALNNTGEILFKIESADIEEKRNGDFEIWMVSKYVNSIPGCLITICIPRDKLNKRVETGDALIIKGYMPQYNGKSQDIQETVRVAQQLKKIFPSEVLWQTRDEENDIPYEYDLMEFITTGNDSSFPPSTPTLTQEKFDNLQTQFVREDLQ